MTPSHPARRLLATDRWRPLGELASRWYERPLGEADGHPARELEAAAERIHGLPVALTEWFGLVGRRLRAIQDAPRRLEELAVVDGAVPVWDENQGVWAVVAPIGSGDDPICRVDDASYTFPAAPLSRTLLGMVVSDTLVGAWAGTRLGPLGALGPGVRGGSLDTFTDDQARALRAAYPALDYVTNPFFAEPYRGDATTVIRLEDVAIEWMTATPEAFGALDAVLDLRPTGGEHEVVVAFERLSDAQQRSLLREHRLPDIARFRAALDGVGHLGMAVGGDSPRLHIRTREPHRVRDCVLAALPDDLRPHVVIAARPIAISVFDVLYPDGRAGYALPAQPG